MAESKKKQTPGKRRPKKATAGPLLDPLGRVLRPLDSITGVEVFGKGKRAFQIIHTDEVDEYEKPRAKVRRKKT
jgi:hypothetical protein